MLRKQHYRYGGLVSKGGLYMVAWMEHNNRKIPFTSTSTGSQDHEET
jgi:thiamine biosynthesis protein ThiC